MTDSSGVILIIEDSPDDFYATQRGLTLAGVTNPIRQCESGEDALDFLQGSGRYSDDPTISRPCVILLDLNLPGIDGAEVLKRIKANQGSRRIPVIVLTTSDDPNEVGTAYDNGAAAFVLKPVDLDGFLGALKRLKEFWFDVAILPRS